MNTQTLERGTITIQHIFPSKGPGKSAWIKDVDGMMFGYWPEKISNVRQGETYEIEFTETVKAGTTYRDIKAARTTTPPAPAPEQFTASQPSQRIEQPRQPQNGNGGGSYYRPTSPKDARRMFLCSTLNAFIQTGRVDCHREHIKQAIGEICAAYDATIALEDVKT